MRETLQSTNVGDMVMHRNNKYVIGRVADVRITKDGVFLFKFEWEDRFRIFDGYVTPTIGETVFNYYYRFSENNKIMLSENEIRASERERILREIADYACAFDKLVSMNANDSASIVRAQVLREMHDFIVKMDYPAHRAFCNTCGRSVAILCHTDCDSSFSNGVPYGTCNNCGHSGKLIS